jgi:hypothetical protein
LEHEMKLFTYMDHLHGTCKAHEIDTPWEPRWTSSDAALGLCDSTMVGTPKQSDQPEQSDDQLPDLENASIFERELASYKKDPDSYKRQNAPAVIVKLLEVDRQHRLQAAQDARERDKPVADMSNEEIERKLVASLADAPDASLADMLAAGLDYIIGRYVTPARQPAAREEAAALVARSQVERAG